jgi:Pregnancy-associated plasma protein-A/Secretion system C-terminal sorting domain
MVNTQGLFTFKSLRLVALTVMTIAVVSAVAQPERICRYNHVDLRTDISSKTSEISDDMTLYIPIVFHIVYANAAQNISVDQIQSQLDVINEDFSRANADASQTLDAFKLLAGNPRIQFFIGNRDGVAGITRTSTTHMPFANDDLHLSLKGGKDAWETDKFLNVWVADLGGQLFGYGASPGSPSFRDGVAVHYQNFGRHANAIAPYNLGRTLTHEIGHWLGLQHIWGNGGCDSTDGIDDTPSQDHPVTGCNLASVSCGTINMVQNFMNSSTDQCMNFFTIQQSSRMRKTLTELRPGAFTIEHLVTALEDNTAIVTEIFPNPLRDDRSITVRLRKDRPAATSFYIVNLQGKVIREFSIDALSEEIEIDMTGEANGFYIAHVLSGQYEIKRKVIVNRNL